MVLRRTILVALLVAVLVPAPVVDADVVVLHSGKVLVGEVKKRDSSRIVLRTRVDGDWTDLTIDLQEVKDVYVDPGHQADDPKENEPLAAAPGPAPREALAIIPLRGQVGGLLDGSVIDTFDAELVGRFLDRAAEAGARAVVLEIESPGGYLDEMEAICEQIIERQGDQRIVAFAGEALSAAAIIALTCRELVVRPDARIGAAVMVRPSPAGLDAVEAKIASPRHARQRQFMAASGRPSELLAAMTIQETRLWWSPGAGFTTESSVADTERGFRLVDGETTVLTMIAEDAIAWNVAAGVAADRSELPAVLGLAEDVRVLDFSDQVSGYIREVDRRRERVLRQFRTYFESLSRIHDVLGQLLTAIRSGRPTDVTRLQEEVRRRARQARSAGVSIRRQDRRLLARRTDIPDALVRQFDEDAETLSRIVQLIREDRPPAWRQARKSVQSILERWRALLGG